MPPFVYLTHIKCIRCRMVRCGPIYWLWDVRFNGHTKCEIFINIEYIICWCCCLFVDGSPTYSYAFSVLSMSPSVLRVFHLLKAGFLLEWNQTLRQPFHNISFILLVAIMMSTAKRLSHTYSLQFAQFMNKRRDQIESLPLHVQLWLIWINII